jgi:DNA-binding NtrC family response regulator
MRNPVPEGLTVLVADDDPMIRHVTEAILRRLGHTVISAADGTKALQCFAESPCTIQLLVSDISMPGLTGPQLMSAVRAVSPSIAVLLMSGTASSPLAHGLPVIQKPFSMDRFTEIVEELLSITNLEEIELEQSAARHRKSDATSG